MVTPAEQALASRNRNDRLIGDAVSAGAGAAANVIVNRYSNRENIQRDIRTVQGALPNPAELSPSLPSSRRELTQAERIVRGDFISAENKVGNLTMSDFI